MGRRATSQKISYDAQVVAFHNIRFDVCTQLSNMVAIHNVDNARQDVVARCEQAIFAFVTSNLDMSRAHASMYVRRYYKYLAYVIVGLEPIKFADFIHTQNVHILQDAKQSILGHPSCENEPQLLSERPSSHFEQVCAELDAACSDGTASLIMPECRKCRTNEFVQFKSSDQTRSADEGMTNTVVCIKCKSEWRVSG